MIVHPRRTIRDAIAARLKGADTVAGQRVFPSRMMPLFRKDLPAVLVYSMSEDVDRDSTMADAFGAVIRHLDIAIEVAIAGADTLDDDIDAAALQVETALAGWIIPGRGADVIRLSKTEIEMMVEGENEFGVLRLTYTVTYRTETPGPTADVDGIPDGVTPVPSFRGPGA